MNEYVVTLRIRDDVIIGQLPDRQEQIKSLDKLIVNLYDEFPARWVITFTREGPTIEQLMKVFSKSK